MRGWTYSWWSTRNEAKALPLFARSASSNGGPPCRARLPVRRRAAACACAVRPRAAGPAPARPAPCARAPRPAPRARRSEAQCSASTSSRRELRRRLAEDDHPEDLVGRDVGLVDRADEPAVVHDADPVGQVEDVVDVVADEEDPDALALQLPDQVPDLRRLGRPERRGGLVHDQDLGVEMDRARDRHRLALAAGEGLDRDREALEVRVQAAHDLAGRVLHRRVVERPVAGQQLAAEEQVAGRRDVVGQGQGLVDRLDAEVLGVARVGDRTGLPSIRISPESAAMGARQRPHQRGLAGAVARRPGR